MGVALLLVSLWEAVCAHSPVWFEEFVAVNEFIIEFVLVDGGYGCDGLRGLGLVPYVVPY